MGVPPFLLMRTQFWMLGVIFWKVLTSVIPHLWRQLVDPDRPTDGTLGEPRRKPTHNQTPMPITHVGVTTFGEWGHNGGSTLSHLIFWAPKSPKRIITGHFGITLLWYTSYSLELYIVIYFYLHIYIFFILFLYFIIFVFSCTICMGLGSYFHLYIFFIYPCSGTSWHIIEFLPTIMYI